GVLFIAYHILGLVVGFVIMGVLSSVGCLTGDPTAMTILTAIGVGIGTFLIVLSVPGIIAGIALLMRRRWARILALIVGAFDLIDIPFGTALGIYSFWVLLHDDTIRVFDANRTPPPTIESA
ncbi:MAG: hypothetical protein U9Q95_05340, partial [Candidatus Eisenbacteria bacterium]|nr:hypothetical protein [Candidatus Eisenbacteria bacterium]